MPLSRKKASRWPCREVEGEVVVGVLGVAARDVTVDVVVVGPAEGPAAEAAERVPLPGALGVGPAGEKDEEERAGGRAWT